MEKKKSPTCVFLDVCFAKPFDKPDLVIIGPKRFFTNTQLMKKILRFPANWWPEMVITVRSGI